MNIPQYYVDKLVRGLSEGGVRESLIIDPLWSVLLIGQRPVVDPSASSQSSVTLRTQ